MGKKSYGPGMIKVREGIDHVRLRPTMYIGDVGETGLHHLISEVVDNSIDEALAGFCTEIEVTLRADGSVSILDDGRGIPAGLHETGRSAIEVALTRVGAGGKFDKEAYNVSSGLHGVGVSCVNALSTSLEVEVYQDGKIYFQRYHRAIPQGDVSVIGDTSRSGTRVSFTPDPEIFADCSFKFAMISRRLRDLAYLNPGLKITLGQEARGGDDARTELYHYPDGLEAFVHYLNGGEEALLKEPIAVKRALEGDKPGEQVEVECAIQYNNGYSEALRSYVNDINTSEGGTHVAGFRAAFTTAFNNLIQRSAEAPARASLRKTTKRAKSAVLPGGEAYREGLVVVLSVKIPNPNFSSQAKVRLTNADVKGQVQQVLGEALATWIEENPSSAQLIIAKAQESQRVRDSVRKARDLARKSGKSMKAPKKLADCSSKDASKSEIFMVEGDSAGGSARQGRDAETQAILPLRGKILNVWKATDDKMLGHEEIQAIISALGTGILEDFKAEACRYQKIIIMCDADVDGSHIRTLLLTFLFRQMPQLIAMGYVYLACPPLYGIKRKGEKGGLTYVLDEDEFRQQMQQQGLDGTRLIVEGDRPRTLQGEELQMLKSVLERLESQNCKLIRRGYSLEEFLSDRNDQGELLYSLITTEIEGLSHTLSTYSEAEHIEVIERLSEAKRGELKVWEDSESFLERGESTIQVAKFAVNRLQIALLLSELAELEFTMGQYFGTGQGSISDEKLLDESFDIGRLEVDEAPFRIVNEHTRQECKLDALDQLPAALLELGKAGITVKRFKGLGEMNAGELWDTTMDPKRRKLKQVQLEDVAEAQRSFSVLMGNKVEMRRAFIETRSRQVEVDELDF